jgi:hypothetical protein
VTRRAVTGTINNEQLRDGSGPKASCCSLYPGKQGASVNRSSPAAMGALLKRARSSGGREPDEALGSMAGTASGLRHSHAARVQARNCPKLQAQSLEAQSLAAHCARGQSMTMHGWTAKHYAISAAIILVAVGAFVHSWS